MMISTVKPMAQRVNSRPASGRAAPFQPCTSYQRLIVRSQKQEFHEEEPNRRDLLVLFGLLSGISVAEAAHADDAYEELKALSAARTGSSSLLESFAATKGAVSSSKASRGIREKLTAEAAPSVKTGGTSLKIFGSSTPKPSPSAAAAAKPKPKPFSAASPKASTAAASAGGTSSLAVGPLLQAAGVLGLVGVGASVATSAATSKPKSASAPAPQPARAASPSTAATASRSSTGKVQAGTGKVQMPPAAAPSRSSTGKVLAGATAAAAKSATGKVTAGRPSTPSLKAAMGRKGQQAAAASGSTVKMVVKQALVNEEAPDEPTDFATGGFLGFVGILAAFILFGLPKPQVVTPTTSTTLDPLVAEAKKAGVGATSQTYTNPLFKSAQESAAAGSSRRTPMAAASKVVAGVTTPVKPAAVVAPVAPPKPAAVAKTPQPPNAATAKIEVPKPAVSSPVLKASPAKPAAGAAAPAAAVKAPAQEGSGPSAAQNLLVVAGGVAVVVTAFAVTGGNREDENSATAAGANSTPAAAAAGDGAVAATAASSSASAAVTEGVSAAASAVAASAPSEEVQPGNAAYDQVVMALMANPEVTQDLFSVMSEGDASLRNIPALAWSLVSTPSNVERLDGFAFQKLPQQRYQTVRQMLLDGGLVLPDSPKVQSGAAAVLVPAGDVGSRDVDPEKLRGVFGALLANPASRTLMRQLLKGAGMPFNEEAFEEQVKDANYFNLAIAPILRSMPQQKLRVLAELQDPAKLQQLVTSVSSLAQDDQQLQAVTAELSGDVRQTVNTIREAEQRAASSSSSAPASS